VRREKDDYQSVPCHGDGCLFRARRVLLRDIDVHSFFFSCCCCPKSSTSSYLPRPRFVALDGSAPTHRNIISIADGCGALVKNIISFHARAHMPRAFIIFRIDRCSSSSHISPNGVRCQWRADTYLASLSRERGWRGGGTVYAICVLGSVTERKDSMMMMEMAATTTTTPRIGNR
jgi:hypothetical protein